MLKQAYFNFNTQGKLYLFNIIILYFMNLLLIIIERKAVTNVDNKNLIPFTASKTP